MMRVLIGYIHIYIPSLDACLDEIEKVDDEMDQNLEYYKLFKKMIEVGREVDKYDGCTINDHYMENILFRKSFYVYSENHKFEITNDGYTEELIIDGTSYYRDSYYDSSYYKNKQEEGDSSSTNDHYSSSSRSGSSSNNYYDFDDFYEDTYGDYDSEDDAYEAWDSLYN